MRGSAPRGGWGVYRLVTKFWFWCHCISAPSSSVEEHRPGLGHINMKGIHLFGVVCVSMLRGLFRCVCSRLLALYKCPYWRESTISRSIPVASLECWDDVYSGDGQEVESRRWGLLQLRCGVPCPECFRRMMSVPLSGIALCQYERSTSHYATIQCLCGGCHESKLSPSLFPDEFPVARLGSGLEPWAKGQILTFWVRNRSARAVFYLGHSGQCGLCVV